MMCVIHCHWLTIAAQSVFTQCITRRQLIINAQLQSHVVRNISLLVKLAGGATRYNMQMYKIMQVLAGNVAFN